MAGWYGVTESTMSEKLTTHTPEAQVPKEAPQAPKEAVKPTETPEAVLAKAV